ncbi:MAG: hypothetical protein LBR79_02535 [Oscillospiraceae bacterium]|jgi:hypothetical protein|nr:hypothetical protein [Oscillospiraceae bacterium]
MIKNFRKSLIFLICAIISTQSVYNAVPPEVGERPNINREMLIQKFRNPPTDECQPDEFRNLQIVYIQGENSRWDYRTIRVMNYAGAFGDESYCRGIFRKLSELFQTLVCNPQNGAGLSARVNYMRSGILQGAQGAAVAATCWVARAAEARQKVSQLAASLGVNENAVYLALVNVAKWLGAHPMVTVAIVFVSTAVSVAFITESCARSKQLERDARNVTQLFQDMIQFLRNERYKGGNLICYAIDERGLHFWNIFQKDLGTWVGPLNIPNLPNAVVDERYYQKFQDLTRTIDGFFRTEGVARGLRLIPEEEQRRT